MARILRRRPESSRELSGRLLTQVVFYATKLHSRRICWNWQNKQEAGMRVEIYVRVSTANNGQEPTMHTRAS